MRLKPVNDKIVITEKEKKFYQDKLDKVIKLVEELK